MNDCIFPKCNAAKEVTASKVQYLWCNNCPKKPKKKKRPVKK